MFIVYRLWPRPQEPSSARYMSSGTDTDNLHADKSNDLHGRQSKYSAGRLCPGRRGFPAASACSPTPGATSATPDTARHGPLASARPSTKPPVRQVQHSNTSPASPHPSAHLHPHPTPIPNKRRPAVAAHASSRSVWSAGHDRLVTNGRRNEQRCHAGSSG